MKKIVLFAGLLTFLSSSIFVINGGFQLIKSGYQLPLSSKGKYIESVVPISWWHMIDDVDFDGNQITILSKAQRLGMVSMGNTVQVGSGNKFSPVLKVNKFNLTDMSATAESFPVNLADITGKSAAYTILDADKLGTVIGTSEDDPRLSTLRKEYPKAFDYIDKPIVATEPILTRIEPWYGLGQFSYTVYTSSRKTNIFGQLEYTNTPQKIIPESVSFGEGDYKLFPWGIDFFNEKRKTITLPIGCLRKDVKNEQYKNITYVTYGTDGKIVNQTNLKFDFTKDHEFIDLVYNNATGEKQLVCILGDRLFMGKQNDPEPNKFTLLVLNPDGSKKLVKDFQYGAKSTEFIPAFAYMDGDITYVVSRNKLTATLETFVFDAKGDFTIQKNQYANLMTMTYGNKSAAMGFTAGAQKYKPLGTYKLSTGNILLVADDVVMETVPNPNAVVGSTMSQTMEVPRYKNIVAFEFTPSGECKGQYVIYKDYNNIKIQTPIEKIFVKNDRVGILSVDKRFDVVNPILQSLDRNQKFVDVGCNEACKPAVFYFDTNGKAAAAFKPTDPLFITLYGTGSYFILNNESGVAYYGVKTGTPATELELQVHVIRF